MKKIKKVVLICLISIIALYFSFIILTMISLVIGPSKDDIVLFYDNKYSISKTPLGLSLFDNDAGQIIPSVKGYLILSDKSYIINDIHMVTISNLNGTYTIEEISELNDSETYILKQIIKIEISN